jgi:hypothetical protein
VIITHPLTRRVVAAFLLGMGLVVYSAEVWHSVSKSERFRIRRLSVDLSERSPRLEEPMIQDLQDVLRRVQGRSIFDREVVNVVGERIRMLPWVEQLHGVERVFPDRIRPILRVRRPVAALASVEGPAILVDAAGSPLPDGYYPSTSLGEVPLLRGVRGGDGSAAEVQEGVEIVLELKGAGITDLVRVREVDLSNLRGRRALGESEVLLRTTGGTTIEWGRSIRNPRSLDEPSPAQKVAGLKKVLRLYPGLDELRRVRLQFSETPVEIARAAPGADS